MFEDVELYDIQVVNDNIFILKYISDWDKELKL